MKYLIIYILLLIGCESDFEKKLDIDPVYKYGDSAMYKAGFYSPVCSGTGIIIEKVNKFKLTYYYVQPPKEEIKNGCPEKIRIAFKRKK